MVKFNCAHMDLASITHSWQ